MTVRGLTDQVPVTAFRGAASWIGYPMVSGHWYTGPGQADVPLGFLTATGTKVGDTITIMLAGQQIPVRIVGDVFDTDNAGLTMLTDLQTLTRAGRGSRPTCMRSGSGRTSIRSPTRTRSARTCPMASRPGNATPPDHLSRMRSP